MPLIFVGALSLIGAVSVVVKTVTADADGCTNGLRLAVTADPAIAPVISEIGQRWSATRPAVGEDCVRVEVTPMAAADLANSLGTFAGGTVDVAASPAPTPSASDLPAVWIPDSSYWLGRLRVIDRDIFEGQPASIAASPVVLAMPEEAARQGQLGRGLDAAALKGMLTTSNLKLGAVEPRRDTAGMIGAMMISDAIVTSERNLPDLVGAYRARTEAVSDAAALWPLLGQGVGAVITSERAVLTYNSTTPTAPVSAVTLSDAATLDFPYTVLSGQPRQLVVAADLFRAALLQPEYQSVFAAHGLRSPEGVAAAGFPTGHGITAAQVHVQAVTDLAKVKSAMTVWVAAKTPSRVLAFVDATSSMAKPMTGGGSTQIRMEVLRATATFGLQLFTNESQLGLWAFAGPGRQPLVPLGLLNAAQRGKLNTAVQQATPQPIDSCALYQTIIEGYRALLDGYDPLLSNTLVVFTDSRDTTGVEMRAVQRELEKLTDVTKPVRVVLMGVGPDVNLAELQAIVDTTGGAAFQVQNPSDVQGIFLKALLT
jgi:hypothetical protein